MLVAYNNRSFIKCKPYQACMHVAHHDRSPRDCSPTNICMLLKTERVPNFKVIPDHTPQKPENRTFLVLPLSLYLSCHGRTVHCTRLSAFVSLTYEHANYDLTLAFGAILVLCVHVELVAPVLTARIHSQYQRTINTTAENLAAAIAVHSNAGTAV